MTHEELIARGEPCDPFGPVYAAIVLNENLRAGYRREFNQIVRWLVVRFNGAYSRDRIIRALNRLEENGAIETWIEENTGARAIALSPRFLPRNTGGRRRNNG